MAESKKSHADGRQKPQTQDLKPDDEPFRGITLDIPTGGLDGMSDEMLDFSKRGSIFIGGQKVNSNAIAASGCLRPGPPSRRVKSNPSLRSKPARVLSLDEESMSQKLRAIYEHGNEDTAVWGERASLLLRNSAIPEENIPSVDSASARPISGATSASDVRSTASTIGVTSGRRRASFIEREENELAGGLEDWHEISNGDVDRYGFIIHKSASNVETMDGSSSKLPSPLEPQTLQRVTSSLQLVSETPRRKRTIGRSSSTTKRSNSPNIDREASVRGIRPASSQSSYQASLRGSGSRLRTATNKLPHNRGRRIVDEAGDMLTLKPSLTLALQNKLKEDLDDPVARHKELEREAKWRRMARRISPNGAGGGMNFDFDVRSNKVIERTWKGIPDSWRATAWHSFLSASARKSKDSLSDRELIRLFSDYQTQSSPDDYQIDLDVPRTISSHIMFRRRYRGGQRLLFRVLHAMSLHFPGTGYVQGMASLAATFLSYYDEENAFVMLVRLWQLRGLNMLYQGGLAGLMDALEDFRTQWLAGGEVAEKLAKLGIEPTAYGIKWYLTLFNYSIPFSAQLRVWDVFMLLGDLDEPPSETKSSGGSFGSTLDILHAAAAALIDGTRDILLESDFDDAMKILTSWIPIKDDDLFMRVLKTEWKMHKKKRRSG
ncbi:MAG: hypothetical protein Q9160_002237 [Pyrenula sp. 1 TL-2023]